MKSRTIGYFVFDGVVALEFIGPLQVFDLAGRIAVKRGLAEAHPFRAQVLGRTGAAVRSREGVSIGVDGSIESHEPLDMVIVAGGALQAELDDAKVQSWLRRVSETTEVTGSVCVGSFLLGKAGLLDGLDATTHFDDVGDLAGIAPKARVVADRLWVDEKRIVTSGGFAAGIDMALHLVARLAGDDLATETARQLEYPRREALDRRF